MNWTNSPEHLKALSKVKCFVLDMDGTFYLGNNLIEGSLRFYEEIYKAGKQILFLTNNSSHNRRYYVEKLNRMGCPATEANIYTSGMATCQYLNRYHPGKTVGLLGNEFLHEEFAGYGITVTEDDPDILVAGFDTSLDYRKLCIFCDWVREGKPYIATHPDFNCPTETGFIPDLGAFMALIEASTGRKADLIIGKPYGDIVTGMLEMTGLPEDELCICGDRLYTDVATGVNHGILSVCVLSGETHPEDLETSPVQPHLVFDRLEQILDEI